MQVVHIAFTYLRLTLICFHFECEILGKIPDSILDSTLALQGKEGDIVRETISLAKHANSKTKFFYGKLKAKYLESLLTFSYVFFF